MLDTRCLMLDELPRFGSLAVGAGSSHRDPRVTLTKLPKFEMFEEGSQIRRAIKSVKSNIVEGYGRRRYKQKFVRFVDYSLASCDETTDPLDMLVATKSLTDVAIIDQLTRKLDELGRKLNLFLQIAERSHRSEK